MISSLRRIVKQNGKAEITAYEFDQLQAEWITRVGADDLIAAANERIMELSVSYDAACILVAKMHEAAVGEVCGPKIGAIEDVKAVAQALTAEREVSDKLENALRNLMEWQVVNVDKWHNSAYDFASATITKVSAIRSTHTNREQAD